jgi:hypothetical protein
MRRIVLQETLRTQSLSLRNWVEDNGQWHAGPLWKVNSNDRCDSSRLCSGGYRAGADASRLLQKNERTGLVGRVPGSGSPGCTRRLRDLHPRARHRRHRYLRLGRPPLGGHRHAHRLGDPRVVPETPGSKSASGGQHAGIASANVCSAGICSPDIPSGSCSAGICSPDIPSRSCSAGICSPDIPSGSCSADLCSADIPSADIPSADIPSADIPSAIRTVICEEAKRR